MELQILKSESNEMEVELDNLTLVEILRVYLNKDSGVTFAAWRREHPTKKPVLKIKTKGKTTKKALNDAIAFITKDLDKTLADFKKMK